MEVLGNTALCDLRLYLNELLLQGRGIGSFLWRIFFLGEGNCKHCASAWGLPGFSRDCSWKVHYLFFQKFSFKLFPHVKPLQAGTFLCDMWKIRNKVVKFFEKNIHAQRVQMQIIFVANVALWRTKILGTVIENLPSTSITYQTGLEIISRLAPVKLSGQTYFCLDTTCFWPDKCLSFGIIWWHFAVKFMWTIIKILYNTIHATPEFAVTAL